MTSDPQDLINLIRLIVKNKGEYAVNEQRTKNGVVHPLLACLGWDPSNVQEVDPEYAVGNGRVDYCLKRSDVAAVFIEVKRLDEPLVKHEEQLLRYAFERSVTLAALTRYNRKLWMRC
jgi:predicted type IV restriction endonuclease